MHSPVSPFHTRAVPSWEAVTRSMVFPMKLTLMTLQGRQSCRSACL